MEIGFWFIIFVVLLCFINTVIIREIYSKKQIVALIVLWGLNIGLLVLTYGKTEIRLIVAILMLLIVGIAMIPIRQSEEKLMLVVSATNHYRERAKYVINDYKNVYKIIYITSDFAHVAKQRFVCEVENSVQIHVPAYHKNLSINRILSHIIFSYKVFWLMIKLNPSKVYLEIPNNTLVISGVIYKKIFKCDLVLDIFDMWPESFPNKSNNALFKIGMNGWRWTRNSGLIYADEIWIECDYYRELLKAQGVTHDMKTYYLKSQAVPAMIVPNIDESKIELCYVGSVNNIVDLDLIVKLLDCIAKRKQVILHLVGTGETVELLAKRLEEKKVQVICYGIVYEQELLQKIFDKCSFGINLIKEDLAIGITMKSITYLSGGVPLINTVQGDTREFIENNGIGINVERDNPDATVERILSLDIDDIISMKNRAIEVYKKYFYLI